MPIVSEVKTGLTAKELFCLLLHDPLDGIVSVKKPIGVRKNAVFLIDLQSVKYKSLFADDNGAWLTSMPRRKFWVDVSDGEVVGVSSSAAADVRGKRQYTLLRQYGIHKGTKEKLGRRFSRIITTLLDDNNNAGRYAVVQYFHEGDSSEVYLPCHGNAVKMKGAYHRTDPTTIESINAKVQKGTEARSKSKNIYHEVYTECGGDNSRSVSEEPRNTTQIYNASRFKQNHVKDGLTVLIDSLKSQQTGEFLHELTLGHIQTEQTKTGFEPTLQYMLATREQLRDAEKFLTHPEEFSVFGIDPTFELGNFYVTVTTLQHPVLVSAKTGTHPFFVGPSFVHHKREMDNYYYFMTCLQRLNPALRHIQAFGTDGEVALLNAIVAEFPDSINLLCWIHKKANIERYMATKLYVSALVKKVLLRDIFGFQEGTVLIKGLVDAHDSEDFDVRLGQREDKWQAIAPGFYRWFSKHQAESFKARMIECVRKADNWQGRRFTTNGNESLNNSLKQWVGHKKNSLPDFNEKLHQFVICQYNEAKKAVRGCGEYRLAPKFQHLEVDPVEWKKMTEEERTTLLQKVFGRELLMPMLMKFKARILASLFTTRMQIC
ncbi:uncharacterized protein LOC135488544 [Lineus longissimus]|uniref:uncharacterized protein LOC135488544 n=1 Tax=Lineus longissimus TaxID=88925 RepID=UPI00315C8FA4